MDIRKNLTESMLDDPDVTHSIPIENYFGNLDRELKKSGPLGYDKSTNDLVMKDDLDATNICSDNKLIKCIADCKKSHNGPIIDVDGLETLTENLSSDEMTLQKALNLEIRFRKLSLTNVKDPCPLFRQRSLSIDEKKRNLNKLISSHLNFCALASLEDLEIAITEYDVADEAQRKERTVQHLSTETDDSRF